MNNLFEFLNQSPRFSPCPFFPPLPTHISHYPKHSYWVSERERKRWWIYGGKEPFYVPKWDCGGIREFI
jgi:hypothetical protein